MQKQFLPKAWVYWTIFYKNLGELASPKGTSIQRIAAYYIEGLACQITRLWPQIYQKLPFDINHTEDLASNKPYNKDQTKKQRKTDREKNRERLRTIEEIFTLGFDCVTPILEIHLGNTMMWFMWGSNLFWWLNRHPFTLNQLGHLLCCWRCNLSIANFCLYTHLVVCSLGLSAWVVGLIAWVVRTATGCVTFTSGPFH